MQVAKCAFSAVVCGSALPLLLLLQFPLDAEAAQGVLPHVEETCEASRVLRFEEERFNSIISEDANVETLATGFSWAEGPAVVNLPSGPSFLIFSDVKENRAYAWHRGKLDTFLDPSGCHEMSAASVRAGGGLARCESLIEPGSNGLLVLPGNAALTAGEKVDDDAGRPPEVSVIVAEHGNRRVTASSVGDGNGLNAGVAFERRATAVLAETYQGLPLNSPNDVARHPRTGDLFFTDPPYGLNGKEDDPEFAQGFSGVYRIDAAYARARLSEARQSAELATPSSTTTSSVVPIAVDQKAAKVKVALREPALVFDKDAFKRPNGIAFSPDGKKLYVGNSDKTAPETRHIKVFDVEWRPTSTGGDLGANALATGANAFDYSFRNERVFAFADDARTKIDPELDAAAYSANFDGLKVDGRGNVFVAGPGGVHVYGPDGDHLGAVMTGAKTGNVALGADGYLYIAADSKVKRVAWNVA